MSPDHRARINVIKGTVLALLILFATWYGFSHF